MRVLRAVALAAVTIAAVPSSAAATARFAAPDGSTTSITCDASDPCEIHRAIEVVAQSGDDVTIEPGSYAAGPQIVVMTSNLTIHGTAGRPRPQILVTSVGTDDNAFDLSDGTTLRHVAFVDGAENSNGVNAPGDNLVEDVVVTGAAKSQNDVELGAGSLLRDSFVRSTAADQVLVEGHGGTSFVRNVTAVAGDTSTTGLSAFVGSGDSADTTLDVRNTIVLTQTDSGSSDVNTYSADSTHTATLAVAFSNFRKKTSLGPGGVVDLGGNQRARPRLVDPANGNLHERAGSPTINRGAKDPKDGPHDIDGGPRVAGAAIDIGADEFAAQVPLVATGKARAVTSGRATLTGSVNPHGLATTYVFQLGRSKRYQLETLARKLNGHKRVKVAVVVSGLAPGTKFHYRLVARNADGAAHGADRTFRTTSGGR